MESSSDAPQGFSDFQPKPTVAAVKNRENVSIYPLSELANKTAAELPEDVDVSRREVGLIFRKKKEGSLFLVNIVHCFFFILASFR